MSAATATPSYGPVAPRPARHQDAVVFTCDAGHLPYAWAAADRITRMEPGRRFDVVLASPDIDRVPLHLRDGEVRLLPLVPVMPQIGITNPRITIASYFRYLLPGLLRNDYRAMLYCDTDTSLRRPAVQQLFDSIAAPFPLAAVPDFAHREALKPHRSAKGRANSARLRAALGGPDGIYWQSGVLLFQTAPYEAEGITERMMAFAQANQQVMARDRQGDQGALNGSAAHLIALLSPRWNWHNYRWLRPELVRRFDPLLLHFSGGAKPWLLTDDPLAAEVTGDWHAALRRWDPAFVPRPQRGSLAHAAAHPPTGIRPVDKLLVGLRQLGRGIGHAMPAKVGRSGVAEMRRLIETTDIG
ncbi:hypothetical protein DRW48_09695 [Paracoccus suum]|uniref:Glycosyl transferase n=1 Tax=Paracoccus suum TaxID=2259340 RepID=A0A344PKM4_9RHOB|nr:glycosyltransferase [Paracoccus suum]AXC49929.1 hypothetical protein DRW48_09695 [Paracoccus suum]